MTAVAKSLACVDALTDEAVGDIMDGLSKGSVTKFTEVFKLESTMHRSVQTSTTYCGGSQTALSTILAILSKATDLYNSLSTGNSWHIPSGGVFIAVGIVVKTMGSTSAGNRRIKPVFKRIRRSERKRRRRKR